MAGWPTDKAVNSAARELRKTWQGLGYHPKDVAEVALKAAGLPALVSHAEVRAILGTRNPRLPAGTPTPLYGPGGLHPEVGGRSLWLRQDIEAFAVEFQARPNVIARRPQ